MSIFAGLWHQSALLPLAFDPHSLANGLMLSWCTVASGYTIYRLGRGLTARQLKYHQAGATIPPAAKTDASSITASENELPLALFKSAIAHSPNGLIICDAQQPELPIVYASPGFEAITGYSVGEVIGQNCRFLQDHDTQQLGIADIRQAIATGTGCKVLLQNQHKTGRLFWNELTLAPLKNEAGIVTHYVGTQVDISHYLETFKALQNSESRYRHLYEETPAMLHSVDRQGCIVSVSQYWLEKLGYQQQDVIGQPLDSFIAEASREKILGLLSTLTADRVFRDQPCQFLKKNGDRMDVLLSTIADYESDETDNSSLGVIVDITERKKAKEKLRRSEALLRAINNLPPTGIFVMDCHTDEALFINPEFYRIWQLEHLEENVTQKELSGEQLLTECLSNIDLGAFVASSTAQDFTDGNKIVEDEVPLLDGRTLRRIYGPIQENNSTFAYLYVFEDITERKQATQKLAQATEAAKAANHAKSEFLANMSHELRSPLNAILGFTHILKSANPTPEQQKNLEIIYNSGEHLLALINDVLDISKIEAGRVTLTESEFDLYRLLDELQQLFHQTVQEKGLRFEVVRSPNLPRIICSDRLKLRQILINLLSNAVKFTHSGSISVQASPVQAAEAPSTQAAASPKTLRFSVTDTGAGISETDQTRLFEAFVQTQSGLRAQEGTGLGLTISAEYVQLLGGKLTVSSAVGEGSTFSFHIPVISLENHQHSLESVPSSAQGRIIGLAPYQPHHPEPYKILVVDDVILNRKLLSHLLKDVGFEVQEATNGQEAVEQWKQWQPDLIWMDMRMPVMNGEAAAQQIKSLATPEQPACIIALTASAFDDNKISALESGCDDFVSKPIQAHEIFEKMEKYLHVRYQYAQPAPANHQVNDSATSAPVLTPDLLLQAPGKWQYELKQATLDLDDEAILELVAQLPAEHAALAQCIERCVQSLAYKKLLSVLQEADAVNSGSTPPLT